MPYTSHGHWFGPGEPTEPRPQLVAKCGGPGICGDCVHEEAEWTKGIRPEDLADELVELGCLAHENWHLSHVTDPDTTIYWGTHQKWVRATLAPVLNKLADDLDAEADGMSENWTRARGIADGLHRAARRLRGDQS